MRTSITVRSLAASASLQRRYGRGQSLVEVILAAVLLTVAISMVFGALTMIQKITRTEAAKTATITQTDAFAHELTEAASTATAIYVPPATQNLTPLVFLAYDSTGARHRWGWTFDSEAKQLTKCTAFDPLAVNDYDLTCTGVSSSVPLQSFAVSTVDANTLSSELNVPAQTAVATSMDAASRDPQDLVIAGNMIHEVTFADGVGSRTVDLLQSAKPMSVTLVAEANQAPAVGAMNGPATINLQLGTNASTTATYSEQNYGQYVPYLGTNGGWSLTSCTGSGNAIVTLTSYTGDKAMYNVVGALPGSCSFNVIASLATYPVTVNISSAPTPVPTRAPTFAPTALPTDAPTLVANQPPFPAPSVVVTASPDPCGNRLNCVAPTPLSTPIYCATQFGAPSLAATEPTYNGTLKYVGPLPDAAYRSISAAGEEAAKPYFDPRVKSSNELARTPSGNMIVGYWDHFPASGNTAAKGMILMSQNTDCSVTMYVDSESYQEAYSQLFVDIVFDLQSEFGASYSTPAIDATNYSSGNYLQEWCFRAYQQQTQLDIAFTDSNCDGGRMQPVRGPATSDSAPKYNNPLHDTQIFESADGTVSHWVRFLLTPDPSIRYIPIPTLGHAVNNLSSGANLYYPDGAQYYTFGNPNSNTSAGLYIPQH